LGTVDATNAVLRRIRTRVSQKMRSAFTGWNAATTGARCRACTSNGWARNVSAATTKARRAVRSCGKRNEEDRHGDVTEKVTPVAMQSEGARVSAPWENAEADEEQL